MKVYRVDVSRTMEARAIDTTLIAASAGSVDRIAIFCHGWPTGIQLGFEVSDLFRRARLEAFAGAVARWSTADVKIALYACLAGKGGRESFAAALFRAVRDSGREQVTVFAHTDAGHATRNADAALFSPDHPDGEVIAAGGTPLYRRFNSRLDDKSDDLRWRAPYMTVEALRAELQGEP